MNKWEESAGLEIPWIEELQTGSPFEYQTIYQGSDQSLFRCHDIPCTESTSSFPIINLNEGRMGMVVSFCFLKDSQAGAPANTLQRSSRIGSKLKEMGRGSILTERRVWWQGAPSV